jgi:hypothetical protein
VKERRKKVLAGFLISIFIFSGIGIFFLVDYLSIHIHGEFQNPFIFNDRTPVASLSDWNVRREEIKEILMDIEYGHIPPHPDKLNVTLQTTIVRSDGSTYQVFTLTVIPSLLKPLEHFNFTLDMYSPAGVGPFPVIVNVGPDGRGSQIDYNQSITSRGYIYACFHNEDLDPDESNGIYDIIGPAQAAYLGYDWGSLGVWAWGAMRVADYLLAEDWVEAPDGFPNVREDALIVIGHSRRGKTSLIAAAFDERFSMVDCNGGGIGGAGSYLVMGSQSESLASITSPFVYFYWFQKDFGKYAYRESALPFDQHFLRALVAPRIMLTTDGFDDLWANPLGTQAVYEAAQPVFNYLGNGLNNTIHFRPGGHGFLEEDFSTMLNLSDSRLLGIGGLIGDYYMTPFDMEFPFNYEAPV